MTVNAWVAVAPLSDSIDAVGGLTAIEVTVDVPSNEPPSPSDPPPESVVGPPASSEDFAPAPPPPEPHAAAIAAARTSPSVAYETVCEVTRLMIDPSSKE